MDAANRAYYEVVFERDFLKKGETEFQNWFSEIMEKCHPNDFQRVRPWGNVGDRKNDGYLRSQRILFQVYAPNEIRMADTLKKIKEDFSGAYPYWREYFDCWTFVYNTRKGLAPDILKTLLALEHDFKPVITRQMGYEELRSKVFSLCDVDLASLMGPPAYNVDGSKIGQAELLKILKQIQGAEPPIKRKIPKVSSQKLNYNQLSESIRVLIRQGMRKSPLVGELFQKYHDPSFGDRVAERFHLKYLELAGQGLDPDLVFFELQAFTGGSQRGTPEHERAVITILAYLFESCDIFEKPPEVL